MISVEAFAEHVAEVRRTGRLDRVLARHGWTMADWSAVKARVAAELRGEEARRRFVAAYQSAVRAAPEGHFGADVTGQVAPPEELQRMIREAEPRFAMAHAPRTTVIAPSVAAVEDVDPSGETAMMPAPEELQRLIQEADPRRAMKP